MIDYGSISAQHKTLILKLQQLGIKEEAVLQALCAIPRQHFVDKALEHLAYDNYPLSIGYQQTISQPFIVAYMTEKLIENLYPNKVLEIGTGSGYQAAILATIIPKVYTIEYLYPLYQSAKERLEALHLDNIFCRYGNGRHGWHQHAPYPAIMVTAAAFDHAPELLLEQLTIGGRMIIPIEEENAYQRLYKITRTPTGYNKQFLLDVSFVPLVDDF